MGKFLIIITSIVAVFHIATPNKIKNINSSVIDKKTPIEYTHKQVMQEAILDGFGVTDSLTHMN